MLRVIQLSFYDWNLLPNVPNTFIGLGTYRAAFQDDQFWLALKNTAGYVAITMTGQLTLGLFLAILLDPLTTGKVLIRTLLYIPVVTSVVVASLVFRYLFNSSDAGLMNYLLTDFLGVVKEPISWLREAKTAFIPVYFLGIWKGVGWAMVIFLAALQTIPESYREAAAIDGASDSQITFKIILPIMLPTIILVMILLTIGAFKVYVEVALITGGAPLHRTEVLLSYMYYQAFDHLNFGYANALSFILAMIIFGINRLQLKLERR
jgi:multiple sugar transport system permease protein